MTKEQIETKIRELEEMKTKRNEKVERSRVDLAVAQTKVTQLERDIAENVWERTGEAQELEELKTALKILNR